MDVTYRELRPGDLVRVGGEWLRVWAHARGDLLLQRPCGRPEWYGPVGAGETFAVCRA